MFSLKLIRWCFLFSVMVALITLSHIHLSSADRSQSSPAIVSSFDRLNHLDLSAAQGQVGVGVMDLNTGKSWFHNGDSRSEQLSRRKRRLKDERNFG